MGFLDPKPQTTAGLDAAVTAKINTPASAIATALSATFGDEKWAPDANGTDDTAALQAVHDAMPSTGGVIRLRKGVYKTPTGGLTISKPLKIVGAGGMSALGLAATRIECASLTAVPITVSSHGVTFEDFAVINTSGGNPTAGAGILFTAGNYTRINRVTVTGFYDNIDFEQGFYYQVTNCHIFDPVRYGLVFKNTAVGQGDHGDQIVSGNVIGGLASPRIPEAAVYWESGGGLRFTGNKINGSITPVGTHSSIGTGLLIAVADAVSTSVFVICGNSIEAWNNAGIDIKQKAGSTGTGSIGLISITGNEIYGNNGTAVAVHPAVASNFRSITIDGNVMGACSTGILLSNVDTVNIGVNSYTSLTAKVIDLLAGVTNYRMVPQAAKGTGAGLVLFADAGADAGTLLGLGSHRLERDIPDVTSNAVYSVLHRVQIPEYNGGVLQLSLTGNLNGLGAFVYKVDVTYSRVTGAVTCTPGTVTTVGGPIDVQFDTATTSSEIYIGVKRNGSTGTKIQGQSRLDIHGRAKKITHE